MKQVRLFLDYNCHPIWVYEDNNESSIENGISSIDEIKNNEDLVMLLDEIQREYESLFINNSIEFRYVGFKDKKKQISFENKLEKAYRMLESILKDKYEVIYDIYL